MKVDVLATPVESATALAARLKPTGVIMLAEKVETRDVYEQMGKAGFTLFQGYDFCKPVIKTGTAIPAQQLVYVRLLAALSNPQLGILELEALVKQDVSLSLRVLKFVNSAAVPVRTEVGTIRQALVLIGMNPIRKWAAVWCLAGLNAGATPELATLALVRARLCELLSEYSQDLDSSELFLVGLCSLLDVMLSRSMADALESLPLSAVTTEALLGTQNKERAVLDAAIAFESGAWEDAAAAARRGGLDPDLLPSAYTSAVQWAQEVARGGITAPPAP